MAMPEPRRWTRARLLAIGAVLLLHALLLGWLQQAWHRAETHRGQRSATLRMITITLPPLADAASVRKPKAAPERIARPAPAARSTAPVPPPARVRTPAPEAASPVDEPRATVIVAAPMPASAASAPSGRELLYGAATRNAIRQSAQGQPLLAERADQASQAPDKVEASARLGQEMMKGATGDCLKGEYAGGGMGLLSAPFWLLAEARGKCRR